MAIQASEFQASSFPTTLDTTKHKHELPNAQPEAMAPALASIDRTEPERSVNNNINAVSSPPHSCRACGGGHQSPSDPHNPPTFEEQGPGTHRGVKRKLPDPPTYSPTTRPHHTHTAATTSDCLLSKRAKAAPSSSSVATCRLRKSLTGHGDIKGSI